MLSTIKSSLQLPEPRVRGTKKNLSVSCCWKTFKLARERAAAAQKLNLVKYKKGNTLVFCSLPALIYLFFATAARIG
jgi:hypothetical protein